MTERTLFTSETDIRDEERFHLRSGRSIYHLRETIANASLKALIDLIIERIGKSTDTFVAHNLDDDRDVYLGFKLGNSYYEINAKHSTGFRIDGTEYGLTVIPQGAGRFTRTYLNKEQLIDALDGYFQKYA